MINVGVRKLLPPTWKAFAWVDADIEFENTSWASDTLKVLNGTKDIVQIFSHAIDMNYNMSTMRIFNSAGFQYVKELPYSNTGDNQWHPGYAWAMTRKAYDKIGGLYEKAILGSGDNIMMLSLLGHGLKAVNSKSTEDYKNSIIEFENNMKHLRFGYIPGIIRHYYHGSKANRKYNDRWKILIKYNFSPDIHITYDMNGIIIPTPMFSDDFKKEIFDYFKERNEDDI